MTVFICLFVFCKKHISPSIGTQIDTKTELEGGWYVERLCTLHSLNNVQKVFQLFVRLLQIYFFKNLCT